MFPGGFVPQQHHGTGNRDLNPIGNNPPSSQPSGSQVGPHDPIFQHVQDNQGGDKEVNPPEGARFEPITPTTDDESRGIPPPHKITPSDSEHYGRGRESVFRGEPTADHERPRDY